jgi:hypothetical protein
MGENPSIFLFDAGIHHETFNMPDIKIQIVNTRMHTDSFPACRGMRLRTGLFPVLAAAAFLLLLIIPATAHAPSNVTIAYNPDMHRLSVTVTHPVDDPKTHYIRGVQVKINGAVISAPPYKSQPGRNSFTYTYDAMLNPEDSVWVVATCVNGQSLENHYDIPKAVHATAPAPTLPPATATSPPATTIPPPATGTTYADAGFLPFIGAAGVLLILKK